jgi:hypothetical protein
MRCRTAIKGILDAELALARPAVRAALDAHLAECAPCARLATRERSLTADLSSLRVASPILIDVTARVARHVAGAAPPAREETRLGPLVASTAGGILAGVALLAGLWRVTPGLWELAGEARTLLAGVWLAASRLAEPAAALAATVARALGGLLASLGPVAESLEALQPVAIVTIAACSLMMVSSIVLVVGRDLMRPRWIREEPR